MASEGNPEKPSVSQPDELEAALEALRLGDSQPAPEPPESLAIDQTAIDALLSRERAEAMTSPPPEPPLLSRDRMDAPMDAPPSPGGSLTQSELDAVLGGADPEAALDASSLDDVIRPNAAVHSSGAIDQAEIDRLLSAAAEPEPPPPEPVEVPPPPGEDSSFEDQFAEIFAEGPAPKHPHETSVGEENLAAAAHAQQSDVGVSQDLLDALLAEAEGAKPAGPASEITMPAPDHAPAPAPAPEAAPAQAPLPEAPVAESGPKQPWNWPRLTASLAAAIVVGLGTFFYLNANPFQRADDLAPMDHARLRPLDHAMRVAQAYIDEGEYAKAVEELATPLANARPSTERTDAEYVYLEAAYNNLGANPTADAVDTLHGRIDRVVEGSRAHARAAEALIWKAHLYDRQELPIAAKAVYREILNNYGMASNLDEVLYDAGGNALSLEDYETAAGYLQRLLVEYPASQYAGAGKLLLGDAYAGAGQRDSARVIYIQVAEANPTTPLGGEAHARLGRLAYDEGRYDAAIEQLETRRQLATSVEGNEQVYLLLAKAQRAAGHPAEAEVVLRELIDFFPENPYTPEAYVELSQVLEEQGMRQEALRLARRTAMVYPTVALVQRNKGELLTNAEAYSEAAEALIAAESLGDDDPNLLLTAARNYERADDLKSAAAVYDDLVTRYPLSPQAFEGGVALADVEYRQGRMQKSLERLEKLATVPEGKSHAIPILNALGDAYDRIGLESKAAQTYGRVAALSAEPETLARAATALLKTGATDEGLKVAERVDRTKISAGRAYELLMRQGRAWLRVDPARGLGLMEEAYASYPEEHTAEWTHHLLEAYLTSDRSAYARRLVMDIEADARQNPARNPELVDAAVTWGDYLYDRQDYRAAADAYALVPETADTVHEDVQWARYQRANALLQVGDFDGSIPLLDTIAANKGRWAEEAALKSQYGRVEQRLRGLDVTPSPDRMAKASS